MGMFIKELTLRQSEKENPATASAGFSTTATSLLVREEFAVRRNDCLAPFAVLVTNANRFAGWI